jgi:hypothetical protein
MKLFVPQSGGIDNRSGFLPGGLVKKKKRLFYRGAFFLFLYRLKWRNRLYFGRFGAIFDCQLENIFPELLEISKKP